MKTVDCEAVGLHSLYLDDKTGTDEERHVIFCDLDPVEGVTLDPLGKDCQRFQDDLRRTMKRFGVKDAYLIKTLKGLHVFAPTLLLRRETERFEESLNKYGSDGFHQYMGYRNGGSVLRVTAKPAEPNGPVFIKRVRSGLGVDETKKWSHVHWSFMADLHGDEFPYPSFPSKADMLADEIRLEAYETTALIKRPEVAPLA